MNDAWIASQWRDELSETLFFSGFNNRCTRETIRGKKAYVFNTEKFCLTIAGKSITIDGKKFRSVREVKNHIGDTYL